MNEEELREAMKKRFTGISTNEWCRLAGCNRAHVYEFVAGKRAPPHDMLRALNLEVRYIKARKRPALSTDQGREGE